MTRRSNKAFTIVEMLVVVSVMAILMGILLPAVGKARDQAKLTQSKANLRNLATAHQTYAAEWQDRQITFCRDDLTSFGSTPDSAYPKFRERYGYDHPPMLLGYRGDEGGFNRAWAYWMNHAPNLGMCQPINFPGEGATPWIDGFGSFRIPNARQFNQYVSGRFYDPVWYAPKDIAAWTSVEGCLDDPGEFCLAGGREEVFWSSYCLSPAAMFNPEVMLNPEQENYWGEKPGYTSPWNLPGGFRSPAMSQAEFSDLKTHMLEHHWLQNRHVECNGQFDDGVYNGCEPYYFNAGWESAPTTLFYDGHVESLGVSEAMKASARNNNQSGYHLWHTGTPFGGTLPEEAGTDYLTGGYYMDVSWDDPNNRRRAVTSFHILTTDGILGRDKIGD